MLSVLREEFRKTLTVDNGHENFEYTEITKKLNTNGLICWYFPKCTDFATIPDESIKAVEGALNNRPRKRLSWRTPLEAFNESVALTD